jgi:hypothetical protein
LIEMDKTFSQFAESSHQIGQSSSQWPEAGYWAFRSPPAVCQPGQPHLWTCG